MNKEHREITVEEFHKEINAQEVEREDHAFICPMCNTVQSAKSLIKAGAGGSIDEVSGYVGFSCVGRFTGAGDARIEGKGCNWSLGGLFQMHQLTITTPDGEKHKLFEIGNKNQAWALRNKNNSTGVFEPVMVIRDENGYWNHPAYVDLFGEREGIPTEEFDLTFKYLGLETKTFVMDESEVDEEKDGYDISYWNPQRPEGEGWFILTIDDSEDGAFCVWARPVE